MRHWMLVGLFLVAPLTAEAAVTEWPVIKQAVSIGKCLGESAGVIMTSIVTHLSGIVVDSVSVVRDCLTHTVDLVTPDPASEETHEVPHS